MKLPAIVREAWLNVTSGTSRTGLFGLALVLVCGALAAADVHQSAAIVRESIRFQQIGGSVAILTSAGRIDGAACEALNEVPSVRAAGAYREEAKRLVAAVLPGAPIPVATVTPSFPSVLRARSGTPGGVTLSEQAAERLGVISGSSVITDVGMMTVAGVYAYPDDGRAQGHGYMALIPVNDAEPFDSCWADIWPQSGQVQALMHIALLPSDGERTQATQSQLNSSAGSTFAGEQQFAMRLTRFGPLVAGALSFALGFISIRTRRLGIASDLHAGVSRRNMRTILGFETLAWIIPAQVMTVALVTLQIVRLAVPDREILLLLALRVVFTGGVCALGGAAFAWWITREQNLFGYFKEH